MNDQILRVRIARETEPLRNLVFALAFSQTGLVDAEAEAEAVAEAINVIKLEQAATTLPPHGWQLLPRRFHRLDADSVVLTNLVGEHVFVAPLLNFPLVRWITAEAKRMNAGHGKDLAFVIATNLALLDDEILEFCAEQGVHLSTSLDGPQDLHNGNRRRPGWDSWQQAVAGIRRVQELGPDRVSALMTTTEASLDRAAEIIDAYADLGLRGVFLRPISPYGFALRGRGGANYDVDRWLEFYAAGLDQIVELNRQAVPMVEIYASIIAKKMLTNSDPGYVDLTSPAGIGIGTVVYNYDGDIYASDEGRMLAEMGDRTFRLGNVHDSSYADVMLSDGLLRPLTESIALSAPMCATCAFEPYCGADPVFHHATAGDFTGHKALSAFCRRNTGVFTLLLRKMRDDPYFRDLMRRWAQ